MLSSKVKNRIIFLTTIALITLVAIFFVIQSLDKNILYFSSPTEIKQSEDVVTGKKMRIGGMVKKNSIKISENNISVYRN
jgi:cytochrome c-type biogenesis protein CcmE